ncbi:MAG: DNA-directed RNA polymerase subunit B, partial [Candidatus Woesearchaeota archaeon]|nr:DNA-directed RNA polymerase subunit B [Candidatus Woesearchaeota archaeon]
MSEVYLNGKYIGDVDQGSGFCAKLREERRRGALLITTNVYYDEVLDAVYVESSNGRARRPVIIVKNGQSLFTERHAKQLEKNEIGWNDLVEQGVIEYIDAAEEENCFVACTPEELAPDHTHLEISPLAMLGITTSLVPFANFIQSARLAIGGKNQKQAIGLYATNYLQRMDMDVNILYYPQNPVVTTLTHDLVGYEKHPHGQNAVIAIMCYKGYNMEDAIIVNQSSIQLGFGRSTYFRPAIAEELRYSGGLMDELGIPGKDVQGYKSERDYRHLEDDGIISPETKVKEEEVIIGKTSPPR